MLMEENNAPPETPANQQPPAQSARLSKARRRALLGMKVLGVVVVVWLFLAYILLPALWRHYEHNPAFADAPKTTLTSQNIPGDPLNVGLIGSEDDVIRAM